MSSIFERKNLEKKGRSADPMIISATGESISRSRFWEIVGNLAARISRFESDSWLLYTEEPGPFLIAFLSLLYSGKNIHLPGLQPSTPRSSDGLPVLSDVESISDLRIFEEKDREQSKCNFSVDRERQKIFFYTSGSTGEPKLIEKSLFQIEREVDVLTSLWEGDISGSAMFTTVSHQHFYGILFSIMLPLVNGTAIGDVRLSFPESLYALPGGKISLVSSPAFLKRIGSLEKNLKGEKKSFNLFSSGGFLPAGTAEFCETFFGVRIREIYGSTETGGIAWRESPGEDLWKPFDVVTVLTEKEGLLQIRSPYLQDNELYTLEDRIEVHEEGRFKLCGRQDSIVKVEEKRVALNDIENRILETGLATDASVIVREEKRQYIAAAIELNDRGRRKFSRSGKKEINNYFRTYLSSFFHPTVLPKKWRYPEKMPVNSQGKIHKSEVAKLFGPVFCDEPEYLSETAVENGWIFRIIFPSNYRYFDGHFPEMKILPAVVQVDCVLSLVGRKLDRRVYLDRMPRMKFQNPIFPDRETDLKIIYTREDRKIAFEYKSHETGSVFSSGKIYLKESV